MVRFLDDANTAILTEAARAINDLPVNEATLPLAETAKRIDYLARPFSDALVRRIVNANFLIGDAESVRRVAEIAANEKVTEAVRREAIAALRDWAGPTSRDRVNGNWRPLAARDTAKIQKSLEPHVPNLLAKATNALQADVTGLVSKLNLQTDDSLFVDWAQDSTRSPATRTAAFELLARRKYAGIEKMLEELLECNDASLRATSRRLMASANPVRGVAELRKAIESQSCDISEKQSAILALADISLEDAGQLLDELLQQAAATKLPAELRLDLFEVAERRPTAKSKSILSKLAQQSEETLSARFGDSLFGGNAERGREIFSNHPVAQCVRCHKAEGRGGDAGPDLSKIATRGDRAHLLQSLIEPNAKIAQGFGAVTLALNNGQVVGGMLKEETADTLTLLAPSGQEIRVRVAEVDERSPPQSPMPTVATSLSKREIRDLVEYLSRLK